MSHTNTRSRHSKRKRKTLQGDYTEVSHTENPKSQIYPHAFTINISAKRC